MRFVNEYRYTIEDTKIVHEAYYGFFKKVQIFHYAALLLAAVSFYLYYQTTLKRFLVFVIIFLIIFALRYIRNYMGAKYDAARIKEETGSDNPMIRCEIDDELRVYRDGKLHFIMPFEEMMGAKETKDALVIFSARSYTALLKNGFYLEGGNMSLKGYLRNKGIAVR